jgi:hypothetical protein
MRFQRTKLILGRGESGLLRKNGHMVLKFKGNMRNMAPNARGVDDQRSGSLVSPLLPRLGTQIEGGL